MDSKAVDVINVVKKLGFNLIIKQFAWSQKSQKKKFFDLRNNINESNNLAKKILKKKVYIVNPTENIMNYYGQADLLITDESSVIYEALLFDLPSLSVLDWKMAQNNSGPKRQPIIDKSVCMTCYKKDLKNKIKNYFENYKFYKKKIIKKKYSHFSYLNKSCKNFYTLIDASINSKKNYFEIKPIYKINYFKCYTRKLLIDLKFFIKTLLNS